MSNNTIRVETDQAAPLGAALHMNGDYGLTRTQSFYDEERQIVMLEYLAEMFDCEVVNEMGRPLKITLTQKLAAREER